MTAFALDPAMTAAVRSGLDKGERIRALNDEFRLTFEGGKVVLTRGVTCLPDKARLEVLWAIRLLPDFTAGNDPYDEHDFGAVTCSCVDYLFKIDCYDLDLEFASPDASDPDFTIRVLTIMRADEY